ncbi:MAG: helix-turn-helix transcriptional regulator [Clostridia bacterium]|nr:helix-turn-helix transcriptional regulator [Clostridia bacterium]
MISGERIKSIRKMRGLTQKELGLAVGFDESTADIRIAQYESDNRTPKANLLNNMADELEVCPYALSEPQIETDLGLLHTLFAIEDLYGLEIKEIDGRYMLSLSAPDTKLEKALSAWCEKKENFENGEIEEEDYNLFRYSYTEASDNKSAAKVVVKRERKPLKKEAPQKKDEYWLL